MEPLLGTQDETDNDFIIDGPSGFRKDIDIEKQEEPSTAPKTQPSKGKSSNPQKPPASFSYEDDDGYTIVTYKKKKRPKQLIPSPTVPLPTKELASSTNNNDSTCSVTKDSICSAVKDSIGTKHQSPITVVWTLA